MFLKLININFRHQLMQKTWSYNCEGRPTFKYCLEILEDLKNKLRDAPSTVILNGHYLTQMPNGKKIHHVSVIDSNERSTVRALYNLLNIL